MKNLAKKLISTVMALAMTAASVSVYAEGAAETAVGQENVFGDASVVTPAATCPHNNLVKSQKLISQRIAGKHSVQHEGKTQICQLMEYTYQIEYKCSSCQAVISYSTQIDEIHTNPHCTD